MRKLLIIISLFAVTELSAQVKVVGYLTTLGSTDTYATHVDSLGVGGYMVTYNMTTRNAIPAARRKIGMMVHYSSADSTFVLIGGTANANWTSFASGSPAKYQIELSNDSENNWTIPFTLSSNATIIYANTPLQAAEWTGEGTTTLTVTVTTKKYDRLTIIN